MNRERLANLKSEVSKQFSGTTKYSKAFRRGNTQALDISQTFPTFEHAFAYALNDTENDNYVPYAGQVISEAENGTVYILRKYSADVRYIDLPVGEGETLESYEIKKTDRFHYYLQEIKTVEGDNSKYLRADADSDNSGHTLTVGKLVSQKGADVTGNVNVTGDVSATGNVTGKNVTATGKVTTPEVVTGGIHSEGADSQQGFSIGKEGNGGYTMYVDNLHVRNKMTAETLGIEETTYVGGKLVLTPGSGIECKKVEYDNFANGIGFKCWFTNEVDGVIKHNTFQIGDLALCESFNNSQHTFYWREVAEVGDDYIILSDVDGKYHTDSDNPKVGDKIVQCGNVNGGERASAIVLSAIDTGSPFVAQYKNIVTFEWTTPVTKLSEDGNIITGTLKTESGKDVEKYINDTNDTITKLQEGMQSLGDDNFVIWQADHPSPKNDAGLISEELTWSAFAPSNSWAVEDLDSHTGDYLICSDGIVYIFREVDKTELEYIWEIVTDKYLIDALNKALQAQESADHAQETADNAKKKLEDMADDGIITAQEKISLSNTWQTIKSQYATKIYEGSQNDFAIEHGTLTGQFTNAFAELTEVMNYVLTDLTTDTDITHLIGDKNLSFTGCWTTYFSAYEDYTKALDYYLKEVTDNLADGVGTALQTLEDMADDGIITAQEKISLKDWWNNELNEANSIITNANKIYGEENDTNANWYKFYALKNLASTLMNNVLSNMDSTTDISAKGSIFVSYTAVRSATKDNSIEGSKRPDKNLVWSEFWAIYYQYKATCQNTAEAKAKVFVTAENVLPKPPYKIGDLWICPKFTSVLVENGHMTPVTYIKETFVCINSKTSKETSAFSDWQVVVDETSSHLEVLKEAIKIWVEQESNIGKKISSGIDVLADSVTIKTQSGDNVTFIKTEDGKITLNSDLIDLSGVEIDLKGKTIDLTADDIKIDSTNFKVTKDGNITATGGTIGGMTINNNGFSSTSVVGSFSFGKDGLAYNSRIYSQTLGQGLRFAVDKDGKLFCNNAEIVGKITATSGKIANMNIASTEVSYQQQAEDGGYFSFGYDGIKAGYMTAEGDGYKPVTTTTIGKDGTITAPNVEFKKDGSGHVAGGNIAWDKNGNASFRGEIQASGGSFMSEDKVNMRKTTIDSQNGDFRMFAPDVIDEYTGKPQTDALQKLIVEIRTYVDPDTNTTFPSLVLQSAGYDDRRIDINPMGGIHITSSDNTQIVIGDYESNHIVISAHGIDIWNGGQIVKSL